MNGGGIGRRNVPGVDGTSGVWSLQEIADAARAGLWTPDPYWLNVTALLHMDGEDGSTIFTDAKGHVFTPTGATQIDTAEAKFGGSSGLFDGSGHIEASASADFGFGSGDYTVEGWLNTASQSSTRGLFDTRVGGAEGIGVYSSVPTNSATNKLVLTNNAAVIAVGSTTMPLGVWVHWAVARAGTTVKGFIDGAEHFSVTDGRTLASSAGARFGSDSGTSRFIGHLDEVRVTKGVARYTASFTPPTVRFPQM